LRQIYTSQFGSFWDAVMRLSMQQTTGITLVGAVVVPPSLRLTQAAATGGLLTPNLINPA
jgi:hypothetical protein